MNEKSPSKDEALEALDFIVNVLKEHEKDLDRLIGELGTVASNLGDTGELGDKVDNVEEKINAIQNQITTLIQYLSRPTNATQTQSAIAQTPKVQITQTEPAKTTPLKLQVNQWEDFQPLATQAQTISFTHKELEKTFEACALQDKQVITYSGELPKITTLLKSWLSKQLQTPESIILEGTLSLG
jgi:hypothetical protein